MHTEEQAKLLWCPMVRIPQMTGANSNRPSQKEAHCIGSVCMMWRRAKDPEFEQEAEAEFRKSGRRMTDNRGFGFCGLAGRPA